MRDEVASFFMGNTANLINDDIVCGKAAWKSRCRLVTEPAGKVRCETISQGETFCWQVQIDVEIVMRHCHAHTGRSV